MVVFLFSLGAGSQREHQNSAQDLQQECNYRSYLSFVDQQEGLVELNHEPHTLTYNLVVYLSGRHYYPDPRGGGESRRGESFEGLDGGDGGEDGEIGNEGEGVGRGGGRGAGGRRRRERGQKTNSC